MANDCSQYFWENKKNGNQTTNQQTCGPTLQALILGSNLHSCWFIHLQSPFCRVPIWSPVLKWGDLSKSWRVKISWKILLNMGGLRPHDLGNLHISCFNHHWNMVKSPLLCCSMRPFLRVSGAIHGVRIRSAILRSWLRSKPTYQKICLFEIWILKKIE